MNSNTKHGFTDESHLSWVCPNFSPYPLLILPQTPPQNPPRIPGNMLTISLTMASEMHYLDSLRALGKNKKQYDFPKPQILVK